MKNIRFVKYISSLALIAGLNILVNSIINNLHINNNQEVKNNKHLAHVSNYTETCFYTATANVDAADIIKGATSGEIKVTLTDDPEGKENTFSVDSVVDNSKFNTINNPTFVNSINVSGKDYVLTKINSNAFAGNYSPVNYKLIGILTLPANLQIIGDGAFDSNKNITNIHFGDNLKSIGVEAFKNCSHLTGILSFPNTLDNIGLEAFALCPITNVELNDNPNFHDIAVGNGHLISTSDEWDHTTPVGRLAWGDFNDLSWLDGETTMPTIFDSCGGITSVTLPSTIISVSYAFDRCSNLREINLENITDSIYLDSTNVRNIELSPTISVDNLQSSDFANDPIVNVELNDNPNFHDIAVGNGHVISTSDEWDHTTPVGRLAWGDFNDLSWLDGETTMPSIFQGCGGITSITLPDSITTISNDCFLECKTLQSINLDRIISIGLNSFENCSNLSGTLNIPKDCTSIGSYAFNQTRYNHIVLNWAKNQNLDDLFQDWLGDRNNLNTVVTVPANEYQWYYDNRVKLGIDQCTIGDIKDLSASSWIKGNNVGGNIAITFGKSGIYGDIFQVTSINDLQAINPIITSKIVIEDINTEYAVNEIGDGLFSNKPNFKGSVTIDSGITTIGSDIFNGDDNITELHLTWNEEQLNTIMGNKSIKSDWLNYLNQNNFKVVVPKGLTKLYDQYKKELDINYCTIVDESNPIPTNNNLPLILGISLGVGLPVLTSAIIGTIIGVKKHKIKKSNKKTK